MAAGDTAVETSAKNTSIIIHTNNNVMTGGLSASKTHNNIHTHTHANQTTVRVRDKYCTIVLLYTSLNVHNVLLSDSAPDLAYVAG